MNVLVGAFDGMDSELVRDFGLDNVIQSEVGTIDVQTNVSTVETSELFASFITGKNWEEHGVTGVTTTDSPYRRWLANNIIPDTIVRNVRGFHALQRKLDCLLGYDI